MKRIVTFFLAAWSSAVIASEDTLGLFEGVEGVQTMRFDVANRTLRCAPYGVVVLADAAAMLPSDCRIALEAYLAAHPEAADFIAAKMKVHQRYRIESRPGGCLVYANGAQTVASMLLETGLALVYPFEDDEHLRYEYRRSELRARMLERGLWGDPRLKECAVNLRLEGE